MILISLIQQFFSVLITFIIVYVICHKRGTDEKLMLKVDPDDDFIRENVIFYDEEGAGKGNPIYKMHYLTLLL